MCVVEVLKKFLPVFLGLSLTIASCSKDEEKVEEVVNDQLADSPGSEDIGNLNATSLSSLSAIYFAFDDYSLSSSAEDTLRGIADAMSASTSGTLQIEGHCDERGSIEYNLALGQRRAESVKTYLVQLGVSGDRIQTISYGEEKPASDGHDESAWSQNRRAEFVVSGN